MKPQEKVLQWVSSLQTLCITLTMLLLMHSPLWWTLYATIGNRSVHCSQENVDIALLHNLGHMIGANAEK